MAPKLTPQEPPLCAQTIYVKDTYRRTGRGPSGFEMHYTKQPCSRTATHGAYCWQHDTERVTTKARIVSPLSAEKGPPSL